MRIVILTQYYYPEAGAAPIRYYEIARELRERGYDVLVLTAFPSHRLEKIPEKYRGKLFMKEEINGVEVLRVWSFPSSRSLKKRLLAYFSFVFSSFLALILMDRFDLILVHSPPLFTGISAIMASFLRRTPFIFNVSDLWPDSAVELDLVKNRFLIEASKKLESFIYKKAWKVVAVTEGIKRSLLEEKGLSLKKVSFLPNGASARVFISEEKRKELIERLGVKEKKVFIYAGNFGFALDIGVILKAAHLLQKEREIYFLLIGDGPQKPKIVDLARKMELKNVKFLSTQPFTEISNYYALSVASIIPLKKKEFFKGTRPFKFFTSLSCGIPVIYCGEGEIGEMIKEIGCGIIVEPENHEKLAEAVLKLSRNLKLAKEMGGKGRRFIEERYNWKILVSSWLKEIGLPQEIKK